MSDADSTHAPVSATATTEDADSNDAAHDHGPSAEPLGAPDLKAWGMAVGGGAIGVLVVLALFAASQS